MARRLVRRVGWSDQLERRRDRVAQRQALRFGMNEQARHGHAEPGPVGGTAGGYPATSATMAASDIADRKRTGIAPESPAVDLVRISYRGMPCLARVLS